MREILFRGKRVDNGEWVEGNLFMPDVVTHRKAPTEILVGTNAVRISYEVIPETVGQYTGLTDRNGTKIFEGDIVKWFSKKYTVVYNDGRFIGEEEPFIGVNEYGFINLYGALEVIGDIHDNTEPLEEE